MRWTTIVSAITACALWCVGASAWAQQLGPVGPVQKHGQLERKPPPAPVVAAQTTFPITALSGLLESTKFHVWVGHANLIPPARQEFFLDQTSEIIVRNIDALPPGRYRAVFAVKRSNMARQLNMRSNGTGSVCAIAVQASYAPNAPVQQCSGEIVTTTAAGGLVVELRVNPVANNPPLNLTVGDITLQRIQ
jgi:hypothetical protein